MRSQSFGITQDPALSAQALLFSLPWLLVLVFPNFNWLPWLLGSYSFEAEKDTEASQLSSPSFPGVLGGAAQTPGRPLESSAFPGWHLSLLGY